VTMSENEIPKLDLRSEDVAEARRKELLRVFPEIHTESGGIDFDALRKALGEHVDVGPERFGMSWPGKAECEKVIQRQSLATLLPVVDESVNWDSTKNVIIEGDNLEVLKVLQKAYLGKVKMIYIDPPYNTGNDFIYPDNFTESLKTYLQYTGQVDAEGRKFSTNTEASGRFHSKWMNMMLPRLSLARNLLTDDGIFIASIDDNEVANLVNLMDEVFGSKNQLAVMIWNKQHSQQQGIFKRYHEYVLVYAKDGELQSNIRGGDGSIEAGALKKISKANPASNFTFPAGVRFDAKDGTRLTGTFGDSEQVTVIQGVLEAMQGRTTTEVTLSAGWTQKNQMTSYFNGEEVIDSKGQRVLEFYFNSAGKLKCRKERTTITPPSILPPYGMVSESTAQLVELMGGHYFDNPKPVRMIADFVSWFSADGDLVMDFFAGSGTTAHAVMSQNSVDGGYRKFILVQLPEPLEADSPARSAGFETVSDITRARVSAAGSRVLGEADENGLTDPGNGIDHSFRSFRLDKSNFAVWDADEIAGDQEKLEQQLLAQVEHVLPGRSSQDILFELMLKSRYELTTPISDELVDQCQVWKVAEGEMVAVIDKGLTVEVIRQIASWQPSSVVILDRCFAGDDSLKANARKILGDAKIDLKTV
jgi:adenine-specific DNA-methyltransferase